MHSFYFDFAPQANYDIYIYIYIYTESTNKVKCIITYGIKQLNANAKECKVMIT